MPDKEKEGAGLPMGGVFVIITLLLSYFIISDQPFKTSRQPTQDAEKSEVIKRTTIEARLWEDPFAAILRSKEYQNAGGDEYKLSSLVDRIAKKIPKTPNDLLILGVMVFGGEYEENVEMRRRHRYAVISALAEAGYYPEDAERLAYVDFRKPGSKRTVAEPETVEVMPYEFFSLDTSVPSEKPAVPHVLVLWLNEDRFHSHPFKNLNSLISDLWESLPQKKIDSSTEVGPHFKLLGPAGSTTLKAMIRENSDKENSDKGPPECSVESDKVKIFCWGATADESFLLGPEAKGNLSQIFERFNFRFYRTIGTDRQLMDALVNELILRGIKSAADHIALISEQDTIYGRTLPKTFMHSLEEIRKEYKNVKLDSSNVLRFTYMRGIDGRISNANTPTKATQSSSQGNQKGSRVEGIEKPAGNSQFDYLRRLTHDLKKIDVDLRKEGGSIKAIGLLGSDIYDKLLVLQAIYELFPTAVFFTTDIDARFLHPDELQWTRNLVIASSFGLNLHPNLQKHTPPFRDSYQTSLFFATRLALAPESEGQKLRDCLSALLQVPRVFEVGRSEAFDLSSKIDSGESRANSCDWLKSIWNMDSPESFSIHPAKREGHFAIMLSRLLGVIVLAFFSCSRYTWSP